MSAVMNEVKDREERKLKKVKISLMRNPKYVMWSGIMMVGSTKINDNFPTAYTNGRDEVYGRAFVDGLSDKELAFVILHENLHKAFQHLTIWRKLWEQDPRLTNMACDYVINNMLVESDPNEQFIAMPRKNGKLDGLYDKKYAGMNTKQVFDLLKQEEEQDGGEGDGDGDGEGGGFDEHGWEDAKGMSEQEKQELAKEIDRALRQGQIAASKMAGKGTGGMDRAIGEILKPKIDWREVLREFMTSVCANKDTATWNRVNRRFIGHDIYMPSLIGETVGRMVVGVDTSGSIGGAILDRFLSEVHAIASDVKPEAIDLLYWDTEVAGHEVYDIGNMDGLVRSTKPRGGGGTDPSCVTPYLKDKQIKPECIIMLTDGCIGDDWGQYDVPVLWVVVGNDYVSPVGKTINVEEL